MPEASLFREKSRTAPKVEAVLHFDGAADPNPGPNCRSAFVLKMGATVVQRSIKIGQATNNIAEYKALIFGLAEALDRGVTDIEVYGDSLLVIRGVKRGPKKSGAPHLEALKAEAISLVRKFHSADLNWIPREENTEADELSKR